MIPDKLAQSREAAYSSTVAGIGIYLALLVEEGIARFLSAQIQFFFELHNSLPCQQYLHSLSDDRQDTDSLDQEAVLERALQ